jgi:hypothetical protein
MWDAELAGFALNFSVKALLAKSEWSLSLVDTIDRDY